MYQIISIGSGKRERAKYEISLKLWKVAKKYGGSNYRGTYQSQQFPKRCCSLCLR